MRRALIAGLLAALCLAGQAGGAAAGGEEAGVLTIKGTEQFEEALKSHPFLVVEFMAPWCGHCKKLAPEFKAAAEQLGGHDPPVALAVVDATDKKNKELKDRFHIRGFPTLKMFKDGDAVEVLEYKGPRDAAGIVRYLRKQVAPPVSQLHSAEEVQAALGSEGSEVVVLGYFSDNTSTHFQHFVEVASALREDIDFYYVTDAQLLHHCPDAACTSPYVVMHSREHKETPVYEGEFTTELLRRWVESHSTPLVVRFGLPASQKHFAKIYASSLPKVIVVPDKESEELQELLQSAARANDDLKFVLAHAKEAKKLLEYYGIKPSDAPLFFIDEPATSARYMRAHARLQDLPEFLKEYKDGALEKHVRSEEPPEKNSGPVKVVTAKTFDELVFGGKTVFLEVYAPWCGHCKKLAPTWDKVGKHFASAEDVVIAKLDGTANDIPTPKIKVSAFPSLFLVAPDGSVAAYKGGRSKDELIKFVEQNRGSTGLHDEL